MGGILNKFYKVGGENHFRLDMSLQMIFNELPDFLSYRKQNQEWGNYFINKDQKSKDEPLSFQEKRGF